jgi:hypothetical protein
MIRGVTKNIALVPPGAYKDLDESENFIPTNIELRNGFMTDAGNWHKRPGYNRKWDVGVDKAINLLIPEDVGYIATEDGRIFKLTTAITELTGARLNGGSKPTWTNHDGTIIVCDGARPIKIVGNVTSALSGSPSKFRFIGRLNPYTVGCGHDDTEWKISASNNPENWTTGDSATFNVKKQGDNDVIKNMGVIKEKLFFFKGSSIEQWYNRGGATPFVRVDFIETGIKADYSLVKESDTFFWLADDLRFRKLVGNRAEVISSPYENYIQSFDNHADIVGYNFKKEHLIKWQCGTEGKTLVYDYKHDIWSEDNHWEHGQYERIPISSYMELNNKQYIGSYNNDGFIYEWSKDYLDDNGNPIRVIKDLTIKPSVNGRNSTFERLGFRFKRGVATSSVLSPKLLWRYRFDRGTWKNYDEIDMGKVGDQDPYVERSGLGAGRELELEIIETDAVDFLLTNLDLTVLELNH